MIIDRNGNLLAEGKTDNVVVQEIQLPAPGKTRQSMTQRRPETYGALSTGKEE